MAPRAANVFDRHVRHADEWVRFVMERLDLEDAQSGYRVLRATLHALRDRLVPTEAADLGAQLPLLIRGIYYDGWTPSGKPRKSRKRDEFLECVQRELVGEIDPETETAVRAVFQLLTRRITRGEIEDVRKMLPREVRELWPSLAELRSGPD